MKEAAERDKCFIKEQLDLYQPDIVIACGFGKKASTASILMNDIYEDSDSKCPSQVNELECYRTDRINRNKSIFVISMRHPNRANIEKWTKLLSELYNTLKNSGEVG